MCWAYELNDFSFDIIHKSGKEQVQSDALSRREQDILCNVDDDRIDITNFWKETLRV